MSKENNLTDFLTDLYDGISIKKPDASRNPQNFRAEIEAIKTGGIPWDGDYTIEGDALPEPPIAYHLTSVDELPADAVDGSLAVVENESDFLGTWVFNDTLVAFPNGTYPMTFESNGIHYDGIGRRSGGGGAYDEIYYTGVAGSKSVYNLITGTWLDNADKTIVVKSEPTDNNGAAWIKANAKRTEAGVSTTLYSRENGKWISKGVI